MRFALLMAKVLTCLLLSTSCFLVEAQETRNAFDVLALYTGKNDRAHISFVHEAILWFKARADKHGFTFSSSPDWNYLNQDTLRKYEVVIFLDTRPESRKHRAAFEQYMKTGGGWMGFHFAAFALTPSAYPQNWDWYHNDFLGCGEYKSNTWRPTAATLAVEDRSHPVAYRIPSTLISAPNEWYRWQRDIRKNPDIRILASIDSTSFPLGTGPKPHEIWHNGDYPVIWTNTQYRMIYFNMGHNDIDYEGNTNLALSSSFQSEMQNRMILNALVWLGTRQTPPISD